MDATNRCGNVPGPDGATIPHLPGESETATPRPWEEIDTGRYMPRRIRGSCRGRELG
jgi:hypothetical protein